MYKAISFWLFCHLFMIPGILFKPFSYMYQFYTMKLKYLLRPKNSPKIHEQKVKKLQKQILEWNRNGRKNKLCTAKSLGFTIRSLNKKSYTQINVNELDDIIEIDTTKKVLKVEPGLCMGTLTWKLLKDGWTIPMIPEFEVLTIGGLVAGTGIESTSHKYGLFYDICLEYEVVTPDGSVVTCSKDQNPDLFYAIPWSHGTLGFLTSVTIPIQRFKKFVKVDYFPTTSIEDASVLLKASNKNIDFIEGLAFGKNKFVVMHGYFEDNPGEGKVHSLDPWYERCWDKHVEFHCFESSSGKPNSQVMSEYIPVRQYYHRHTKGYFWALDHLLGNKVLNTLWFRYLFGWILPFNFALTKALMPASLGSTIFKLHILQDYMIPMDNLKDLVELSHDLLDIYPLWLCPVKFFNKPGMTHSNSKIKADFELFIDVGIYGTTRKAINEVKALKMLEKFALENKGIQFLYGDVYLTRDEFSKMFDMSLYNKVREKLGCTDAFPEIFEKVSRYNRDF